MNPALMRSVFARLPRGVRSKMMAIAMKVMQEPQAAMRKAAILMLLPNFVLIFVPHILRLLLTWRHYGKAEANMDPRLYAAKTFTKNDDALVRRCKGAHLNSLESFPLFSSALMAAFAMNAKPQRLLRLSVRYTLVRAMYIMLYIGGSHPLLALGRTVCYISNMTTVYRLFVLGAGEMLRT